jgi:molecular chaperone GrpE
MSSDDRIAAESAGPAAGEDPPVVRPDDGPLLPPASPTDSTDEAPPSLSDSFEEEETEELGSHVADEIQELAAERDSYRDIAQRLQADFENYRKRVAAQIHDEADRAAGRMAEAMLPVLDAAEAAYLRHPDEVGPLLNVMLGELRKRGLETLDLEGKPFDPTVAEAVTHEPGEGGDVVVAEVLRSGYRWNGRTLRPAMVRTRD